jgi:hypothetical protein
MSQKRQLFDNITGNDGDAGGDLGGQAVLRQQGKDPEPHQSILQDTYVRAQLARRNIANTKVVDAAKTVGLANSGCGLDLIRWHRGKAGTIEHAHDVLMNELAGAALPSQKFGANAAWLRLNVIPYNLLSAYKRVGLPGEFQTARPKRLRFLLLNTVGKVVRHARETLLRCTKQIARALVAPPRTCFALNRPALVGV